MHIWEFTGNNGLFKIALEDIGSSTGVVWFTIEFALHAFWSISFVGPLYVNLQRWIIFLKTFARIWRKKIIWNGMMVSKWRENIWVEYPFKQVLHQKCIMVNKFNMVKIICCNSWKIYANGKYIYIYIITIILIYHSFKCINDLFLAFHIEFTLNSQKNHGLWQGKHNQICTKYIWKLKVIITIMNVWNEVFICSCNVLF